MLHGGVAAQYHMIDCLRIETIRICLIDKHINRVHDFFLHDFGAVFIFDAVGNTADDIRPKRCLLIERRVCADQLHGIHIVQICRNRGGTDIDGKTVDVFGIIHADINDFIFK